MTQYGIHVGPRWAKEKGHEVRPSSERKIPLLLFPQSLGLCTSLNEDP